jgi:hypothetical protein
LLAEWQERTLPAQLLMIWPKLDTDFGTDTRIEKVKFRVSVKKSMSG